MIVRQSQGILDRKDPDRVIPAKCNVIHKSITLPSEMQLFAFLSLVDAMVAETSARFFN
jgi:hypothetical protein